MLFLSASLLIDRRKSRQNTECQQLSTSEIQDFFLYDMLSGKSQDLCNHTCFSSSGFIQSSIELIYWDEQWSVLCLKSFPQIIVIGTPTPALHSLTSNVSPPKKPFLTNRICRLSKYLKTVFLTSYKPRAFKSRLLLLRGKVSEL